MAEKIGKFAYWIGAIIGASAILAALAWNGWEFYEQHEAKTQFAHAAEWLKQNASLADTPQHNRYTDALRTQDMRLASIKRCQELAFLSAQAAAAFAVVIFGVGFTVRESLRRPVNNVVSDLPSSRRWRELTSED